MLTSGARARRLRVVSDDSPNAWAGPGFELLILAGESDEQLAEMLRGVWSDRLLDGPYPERDTEAVDQSRLDLATLPSIGHLFGSIAMPDGIRVGVVTYTMGSSEEGDTTPQLPRWVGVAIRTGALARAYGFDPEHIEPENARGLEEAVTETLRALADALYARVRFRGAVVGDEIVVELRWDEIEEVLLAGRVPPNDGHIGYLLPDGEKLHWHPANPRPPAPIPHGIGVQECWETPLGLVAIFSALLVVFSAGAIMAMAPTRGLLEAGALGVGPATLFAVACVGLARAGYSGRYVSPASVRTASFRVGAGLLLATLALIVYLGASMGLSSDTGSSGLIAHLAYVAGYGITTVQLGVLALREWPERH